MEDIDKYMKMHIAEFLEFIARLGVLLFTENLSQTLQDKIELILVEMFKLIPDKVKHPPKTEDDELVSDFEDDILQVVKRKKREYNHEPFLIVDISKTSKVWNNVIILSIDGRE